MSKVKTKARRIKYPKHFYNHKGEEKYEKFIKHRKILEEKGFQFPKQLNVAVNTIFTATARRGWVKFYAHPRDLVLLFVKKFYFNILKQD